MLVSVINLLEDKIAMGHSIVIILFSRYPADFSEKNTVFSVLVI
jgi:hypothetical protein